MATLLILKGADSGKHVELTGERILLGRNRDCQVLIDFPAVSREHAQIVQVGGKFYIEDRDSRNGTYVNNQQIKGRTPLKENDRIKICDFLCTFHEKLPPRPSIAATPRAEPEAETDSDSSVVEAAVGKLSSAQLIQAQPAEKLKALLEISIHLSKTLELDALLPRIADSLFQLFRQADRCFLVLKDPASGKLFPKLIKTRRPGNEANARFSKSIVQRCLETDESLLSEDATADSRFATSQSIADFRIRSVMCAPLANPEGQAFGVIQLDTQDRAKKFTADDLKLLQGVASQAGIALENVQMHHDLLARERVRRDMELASQVQRSFLPRQSPEIAGYQFFAHYESALEIGGDYYDFIPLPQGRLAVTLGDVAGKGAPAALLMAKLSAEARFCMLMEAQPAAAISRLNDLLLQAGLVDRFVTLAACVLDPAKHQVTIVNAGHMGPLLYRDSGQVVDDIVSADATGLPLGVAEGFQYLATTIDMKPGDTLLLFTDGVTDAYNTQNEAFGLNGIRTALSESRDAPAAAGQRVIQAAKKHSAGRNQHDDVALVCFGRVK